MYYGWYTIRDTIRTIRGQISEGDALIVFTVIDDQFKMIIEDIDGIDKGFNDMAAEGRVGTVSFGEAAKEKQNPVTVHELGL